jgi:hypothetical protein
LSSWVKSELHAVAYLLHVQYRMNVNKQMPRRA